MESGALSQRIRSPGGGRKRLSEHQSDLVHKLEALIEPGVRGDPAILTAQTFTLELPT